MKKNEVLTKLRKLLNLANNKGATEAEAYTAYQQAQKLAIQYGLSLGDISLEEEKKPDNVKEECILDFTFSNAYNQSLIFLIARNFRCEVLVRRGNGIVRGVLVGTETDVMIAKEVLISAYTFMNNEASKRAVPGLSKKDNRYYMNSYRAGFLAGLSTKYQDNLSKLRQEYSASVSEDTGYGLILVKPQSLSEYMKKNYSKSETFTSTARANHGRNMDYYAGYADGKGFGCQIGK